MATRLMMRNGVVKTAQAHAADMDRERDALRKAAEDALPFVESVAAHCHHNCGPESCSAEGQRRAKQGRIIAAGLRRALSKQE